VILRDMVGICDRGMEHTDTLCGELQFHFVTEAGIYSYHSINLMFVVPYILVTYMFNSSPTRCTLYSLFLSSLALHVSGAICTHHQENCRIQP
jgi:hypothetical protein